MRKFLQLFFTALMYLLIAVNSVWSQEYQDFLDSLFTLFPGLEGGANGGLTVLPVLEISPGGERSNLGNAYTAVARDISFFEANPAASSVLERSELAFFHRNLISDVSMDSVMYAQRVGNLGYGFAGKFLHFEFTSVDSRGNQLASANPSEILFAANLSYNFFEGYRPNLWGGFSGLSLGLNAKAVYRNIPSRLYSNNPGFNYIGLEPGSQNLFAYMADVGVLTRFNAFKFYSAREKNASFGISVKNLGPPVKGEALPTQASAGLSYRPFRPLMITGDINYQMNLVDLSKSEGLGFAAGIDVRFVEFFSLQSGFELRGNNPRISLGADIDIRPISFQVNYTLDLTTATNNLDNFSITAKLDFGDGGREEIRKQVDEIYIQALIALSNSDFQEVIRLTNLILDNESGLDPSFTPARSTRQVAIDTLELEARFIEFEQNRESESAQE